MNLQNLNLVELNAQEVQEVDGGGKVPWVDIFLAVADNWDQIKAGFRDGYNDFK
jgi:hypothetical protein